MLDWEPITKEALRKRIYQGEARMRPEELRLWKVIQVEPTNWRQNPYGDQGGGFWVVAIVGSTVVWYNDLEDGFNRSRYASFGTIEDYWCNQDELEVTLQYLMNAIELGSDLALLRTKAMKVPP
jgi:hypothetical protein